jgi:hypothetical protein
MWNRRRAGRQPNACLLVGVHDHLLGLLMTCHLTVVTTGILAAGSQTSVAYECLGEKRSMIGAYVYTHAL